MDTVQLQNLLAESAKTLRAQQSEITKLASLVDSFKRKETAEEIVALMDQRGMSPVNVPHKQKVANVLSSKKDLGVVKEALLMSPTDMSFARVSEEAETGTNSSSKLEEYLRS